MNSKQLVGWALPTDHIQPKQKGLKLINLIIYGTLRNHTISTLIDREACHRQSILITLNINTNKSKMFRGQCPPYWLDKAKIVGGQSAKKYKR